MKTFQKFPLLITFLLLSLSFHPLLGQKFKGSNEVIVKKVTGLQEYSSTMDLNDTRKQLLMAGQNYQTNYGIYASIKIENSSLGPQYRTLKNIEFEIVNYKPTYFIGIDSVVVDSNYGKNTITFKVYTRALSDQQTFSLNKEDLKNIHFEKGSYLHAERYLNPMFPELDKNGNAILMDDGRIACKPDNGKAFDFEFFYKDGTHIVRKANYDKVLDTELKQTNENEIAFGLPGKRCWHSYNKVIF
ncbi:hypothetical protein [Maribacter flavus]|uniref:Uncharacterized protein n=1 Tax=Maribacter flavus TaxID=1658664 RepID=A0A5B2TXQ6_9FLAO|nr:hypothetical protein [Maribacter flavus]KAA2219122.1 hypothetical protein F0361_05795 [Maribacter flavus]